MVNSKKKRKARKINNIRCVAMNQCRFYKLLDRVLPSVTSVLALTKPTSSRFALRKSVAKLRGALRPWQKKRNYARSQNIYSDSSAQHLLTSPRSWERAQIARLGSAGFEQHVSDTLRRGAYLQHTRPHSGSTGMIVNNAAPRHGSPCNPRETSEGPCAHRRWRRPKRPSCGERLVPHACVAAITPRAQTPSRSNSPAALRTRCARCRSDIRF